MRAYELAEALGKQASYVSRLETGAMKDTPSPEDLAALRDVLGLSIVEMLRAAGYEVEVHDDSDMAGTQAVEARLLPLIRRIAWNETRLIGIEGMLRALLADDRRQERDVDEAG